MAGGIQKGMIAMDEHARKIDKSLKDISRSLIDEMKKYGFDYKSSLEHDESRLIGCAPDGGLWFKDGILVAVFEAKKQGASGNAIERWGKNYYLCSAINPKVRYITFGTREGFIEGNYCYRYAQTTLLTEKRQGVIDYDKKMNMLYMDGISWFTDAHSFNDKFIIDIMHKAITGNI